MVSDGLAERGDGGDSKKRGTGSTTQKDTAASVWSPQPHTGDSCEAKPESNGASLPLTANPLPPAGEHIGKKEEQKKVVKKAIRGMRESREQWRPAVAQKFKKVSTGTKQSFCPSGFWKGKRQLMYINVG